MCGKGDRDEEKMEEREGTLAMLGAGRNKLQDWLWKLTWKWLALWINQHNEMNICANSFMTKLIYMKNYLEEIQQRMFNYQTLSPIPFFLPLKNKNRQ